jgi:hypothetical protein
VKAKGRKHIARNGDATGDRAAEKLSSARRWTWSEGELPPPLRGGVVWVTLVTSGAAARRPDAIGRHRVAVRRRKAKSHRQEWRCHGARGGRGGYLAGLPRRMVLPAAGNEKPSGRPLGFEGLDSPPRGQRVGVVPAVVCWRQGPEEERARSDAVYLAPDSFASAASIAARRALRSTFSLSRLAASDRSDSIVACCCLMASMASGTMRP